MAEDAGAADLISGGRLQLGISRGSPKQVIDGFRYFGYLPDEGSTDAEMAREHPRVFLEVLSGKGFALPNPRPMFANLLTEPNQLGVDYNIHVLESVVTHVARSSAGPERQARERWLSPRPVRRRRDARRGSCVPG